VNAPIVRRGAGLIVLLLVGSCPALAQAPTAYLSRGISAYEALDYDAAAGWLRRALTPPLVEALPAPDQVRGLAYLGATEQFRGRADSAAAVFRRMLRLDPRARPDPLVFSPVVMRVFERTRVDFPIVSISGGDATLDAAHPSYRVQLHPSVAHEVTVTLDRSDGRVVDTLYAGPVGDSLTIEWDGRSRGGDRVASGQYWFTATTVPDGPSICRVRMPVEVTVLGDDTLPIPDPVAPHPLPEHSGPGDAPAAFAKGALLGGAALALPMLARDADASRPRVLAVAFGITGFIGYLRFRNGRPLPGNVAANAVARARWQHQVELVAAENRDRRRRGTLWIRVYSPFAVGCGGA